MSDDSELYQRYLRGDDDAFGELIDKYYNGLIFYINGIINNPAETEDIVQNTFVKLAVKALDFKGRSTFKTYVYAIARNQAINYLKRYRSRLSDEPVDEMIVFSDGSDPEKECFRTERNREIRKCMEELNKDYYQVLYLMYFENMKTEEIAMIMKKNKKQVADLLYRAKQSLKTKLKERGIDHEEF